LEQASQCSRDMSQICTNNKVGAKSKSNSKAKRRESRGVSLVMLKHCSSNKKDAKKGKLYRHESNSDNVERKIYCVIQKDTVGGIPRRKLQRPILLRQNGCLKLEINEDRTCLQKNDASELPSIILDDDADERERRSNLRKQRGSKTLQTWEFNLSEKRKTRHERRYSVTISNRSKRSIGGIVKSLTDETLQNLSQIFKSDFSLKEKYDENQENDENLILYKDVKDRIRREMKNFKKSIFNSNMAPEIMQARKTDWFSSFLRLDPRWQIMTFFNDVARAGVEKIETKGLDKMALSPLLRMFSRAHVVSIWRPTSTISIRRMMMGEAVGKGLDIKGKSAKEGLLSGYVPFLQIHSEESDKKKISTLPSHSRIRVFFKTADERLKAINDLEKVLASMLRRSKSSKEIFESKAADDKSYEEALKDKMNYMDNPVILTIDDYAPETFGIDIPDRLFLKAFILQKNIYRQKGTPMYTGRPSEPAFQDMNFAATRKEKKYGSKAVIVQLGGHENNDPLCPLTLVMAYEENERVLPVVSDFDCFLICTKGVKYNIPMPSDQIEVMKRTVHQVGEILHDEKTRIQSWTCNWLNMLKKNASSTFKPKMPQFGYGDPKTYSIMENAINRLKNNGAVRHGSECFNYFFPQEMEETFLVISDKFTEKPWKYLTLPELQDFLLDRIREGFTMPLNLKWILCDRGWKKIYDELFSSQFPHVQDSLDIWYPPQSGIRDQIEQLHSKYPNGFETINKEQNGFLNDDDDPSYAADLAKLELKRYMTLQRAKRKLKTVIAFRNIAIEVRNKANEQNENLSENKQTQ
jgi:hypothetical protein